MADDDLDLDSPPEEGDELTEVSGGFTKKKIILFIILPLLIFGGGGAAAYFTGLLDPILGVEKPCIEITDVDDARYDECQEELALTADGMESTAPGLYYEIPDIRVNLNSRGSKQKFLFLSVKLEVPDEQNLVLVEQYAPRVMDHFQTYLREIRIEDLQGSAGIYRLRRELLERVNAAAPDLKVRDVLFQEMLVQ